MLQVASNVRVRATGERVVVKKELDVCWVYRQLAIMEDDRVKNVTIPEGATKMAGSLETLRSKGSSGRKLDNSAT